MPRMIIKDLKKCENPPSDIRLEGRCKICKLQATHKELFKSIHENILEKCMSYNAAVRWLNLEIDKLNATASPENQLSHFNAMNFSLHFKEHITDLERTSLKAARVLAPKGEKSEYSGTKFTQEDREESSALIKDLVTNAVLPEYQSMSKIIAALERHLSRYEENLDKKMEEGRTISLNEIKEFRENAESLMDLKMSLSKFRNTSEVAGQAVKSAIESTVTAFIDRLILASEETKRLVQDQLPGSSFAEDVVSMLRRNVGDAMKDLIPILYNRIIDTYSIKDLK